MRFRYKALTADGEVIEGEMEAVDESYVLARLQELGHLPVRARPITERSKSRRLLGRRGHRHVRLDIFTRELARLTAAGVPIERALEILIDIADNAQTAGLTHEVLTAIRSGRSLADAMAQAGPPFDALYVGMVRAGEAGGSLPHVLAQLSGYMARMRELRASVTTALTYPTMLLAVSVGSLFLLLAYVVPQFEEVFAGSEVALPRSTQIVFAVAHWLADFWWLPLIAILALMLMFGRLYAMPPSRIWIDRLLLATPMLGSLIVRMEVARMNRTLGALIRSGVPLLNALSIVEGVLTNTVMQEAVRDASTGLKSGSGLAPPLKAGGVFPPLAVHMIRVGEETGRLDVMLNDVADVYDDEVRQQLRRMLALLEPILILGLGVLVGAIIVSVLAGILGLNQLAF